MQCVMTSVAFLRLGQHVALLVTSEQRRRSRCWGHHLQVLWQAVSHAVHLVTSTAAPGHNAAVLQRAGVAPHPTPPASAPPACYSQSPAAPSIGTPSPRIAVAPLLSSGLTTIVHNALAGPLCLLQGVELLVPLDGLQCWDMCTEIRAA